MSVNKKPDLGDSLKNVLSPSKSRKPEESSEESVKPAKNENVTSIDTASEQIKVQKAEPSDPFEEAEIQSDDVIVVEEVEEPELSVSQIIAETNDLKPAQELVPETVGKAKPEKVKPKKAKKTSEKNTSGKGLSGAAIVLSLIAIAGSGYSILSQDGIKQRLAEGNATVESSIADLTDRTDLVQSSLSGMKQSIAENSSDINRLQGIEGEVLKLHESINSIRSEADQVSELIQGHKTTLGEHDEQIANLQSDVKRLASKPKPVAKKTTTRAKAKPKPVVTNSNSIEGATLSTIDQWGSSSYVVLRDESGDWIPLQRGDKYKGWRYSGSTGEQALFKKGSKTKKLRMES
jgi:hypothetical protein